MSEAEIPTKRKRPSKPSASRFTAQRQWLRRWALRMALGGAALLVLWVAFFAIVNPPAGVYMRQEAARLGGVQRTWVSADDIAPVMLRSVVAAEDANFCEHWGFDMSAIRQTIGRGSSGGASTLSQQVVKNVFLWHGRSWARKALEAVLTPVVETTWSKRRILEVYLNIAEFDEGVFGVEAAAKHYFGVTAAKLSATQAARLAMVLPNPKNRSAARPTDWQRKRTASIIDGAQTIAVDGRANCFQL